MIFRCLFALALSVGISAHAVDLKDVDAALKSDKGLVAEMHGVDRDTGLFVLVYRNPQDFFDYVQLPLVADYMSQNYDQIEAELEALNRHDIVGVKGQLDGWVNADQAHILVDSVEMVKKFEGGFDKYPPYHHKAQIPKELQNLSQIVVKVHAVADGGRILMVEYKDVNLPVIVSNPSLTKDLYRGDKIEIQFRLAGSPSAPTHLILKDGPKAVVMLDSLSAQNGKPIDLCGPLVFFPKSPQILFNVFAIQTDIGDGLTRSYTLISFKNPDLFKQAFAKLQVAWDAHVATATRGRNYFVNEKLQACAKGIANVVSPSQANPQIVISQLSDVTVTN